MPALAVKPKLASGQKTSFEAIRIIAVASLVADRHQERDAANDELTSGQSVYAYVNNNPLRYIDPTGESATTALEWCLANPRACGGAVVGAGSAGAAAFFGGIGAALFSPEVCPRDHEEKCRKEWEEAYRICAKEMSRGGHRGITGGYTNEFQCAKGLVSQRCGGNRVN